ncbi:unnamed protein product [Lactuca virosa]|uniref:Uncharacterized protein n=1 Tax=Lactuca virosa TaxID=75947 RepID=A0AAU9LMZ3_9ASTR|nr:unnamed protein product [Lactuca virosa]
MFKAKRLPISQLFEVMVEKIGKDSLINYTITKLLSSDFFANLLWFYITKHFVQSVKMTNSTGKIRYLIKGINILKAHGKSATESYLLKGYALNAGRATQ